MTSHNWIEKSVYDKSFKLAYKDMRSCTHTTTSDSTVSPNVLFRNINHLYGNRFRLANFPSNINVEIMEKGSACWVCIVESCVDVVTSVQHNQSTARIFSSNPSISKHAHKRAWKPYEGFICLYCYGLVWNIWNSIYWHITARHSLWRYFVYSNNVLCCQDVWLAAVLHSHKNRVLNN